MHLYLGSDLEKDITPEEAALDRMRKDGHAIYKGVDLIKAGEGNSAFTCGDIYMGANGSENLLKHEYGHIVQSQELGTSGYTYFVVVPSVFGYALDQLGVLPDNMYYSLPWEYKADEYGGASHTYLKWAKGISDKYWTYTQKISISLS